MTYTERLKQEIEILRKRGKEIQRREATESGIGQHVMTNSQIR